MGCNNTPNINETVILEPLGDDVIIITACTGVYTNHIYSCSGDSEIHLLSGTTIFNKPIEPANDNVISLGSQIRRFREINTVSGYSTIWSASSTVYTANLDLGLDSSGNSRVITAENSIIQDDFLIGGIY